MTTWQIILIIVAAWFVIAPIVVMASIAIWTAWAGGTGPSDQLYGNSVPPSIGGVKNWRRVRQDNKAVKARLKEMRRQPW